MLQIDFSLRVGCWGGHASRVGGPLGSQPPRPCPFSLRPRLCHFSTMVLCHFSTMENPHVEGLAKQEFDNPDRKYRGRGRRFFLKSHCCGVRVFRGGRGDMRSYQPIYVLPPNPAPADLLRSLTYSHSLTHSLGHSLTYSLTHSLSLTQSRSLSLTFTHSHSLTYLLPLTHPLTHSLTLTLTHLLAHSLTYSLTHSLTH